MRCTLLNPHRPGEWLPGVGQQYADATLGGRRRDCAAAFTQLSCQVQTRYQGLSSVGLCTMDCDGASILVFEC